MSRSQPSLVGTIWSRERTDRIDPEALRDTLRSARFVLLGERHDNPRHHRLQAQLVEQLAAGRRRPALVFEMLDREQQPVIEAFLAEARAEPGPADATDLARRVSWAESGWPPFEIYRPLFVVALDEELPLVAAGLPRGETLAPDAPERAPRSGLHESLPEAEKAARIEEMHEAHCGLLPREALADMVEKQRARDVRMAHRSWQAAERQGRAILIAGNGHVQRGRVDAVLRRVGTPRDQIASVGLLEVDPDGSRMPSTDPPAGSPDGLPHGAERFDFTVFTAAVEREDPCEALRSRMAPRR